MKITQLQIGSTRQNGEDSFEVKRPWDGEVIARVAKAGDKAMEEAAALAWESRGAMAKLEPYEKAEILNRISQGIEERHQELSETIRDEAGKPIDLAKGEVSRAVLTFKTAAEEVKKPSGFLVNLAAVEKGAGRQGIVEYFPAGPVLGISPFNFPLNLTCHKVAPAIAAGCPIVIKPASSTPLSALKLGEICQKAGLPAGGISVLPCSGKDAKTLTDDERFKVISFTGSDTVGWSLKDSAKKKKVILELGGDAPVILGADINLEQVIERLAFGPFAYAGQVCISVQRILVHKSRIDEVSEALTTYVKANITSGDPAKSGVLVGPMIDRENVERVLAWVEEAGSKGADILLKPEDRGSVLTPSILRNVPKGAKLATEEVFGPSVHLIPFEDWDDAIRIGNESRYGLQAGIFTNDTRGLFQVFRGLEVGGVIHNDVPTWRVDHMPYGGVKDSGFGREGVAYSMHEMMEPRHLALNP